MNKNEFDFGMERLRSRFNNMEGEFEKILSQQILHEYSWSSFKLACDELLGQHTKPTVQKIVSLVEKHERKASDFTGSKIKVNDCSYCDSYGLVIFLHNGGRVSATCSYCDNGRKQREMSEVGRSLPEALQCAKLGWFPEKVSLRWRYRKVINGGIDTSRKNLIGMKASVQGLCILVEKHGKPSAFQKGLIATGLDEKTFDEIYKDWENGRVHSLAKSASAEEEEAKAFKNLFGL